MKKNIKLFLIIFVIVFLYSWLFGVLRFNWVPAYYFYIILNFPFGFIHISIENYYWSNFEQSHFMNLEINQTIFWIFSILLQAIFDTFIIWTIKSKRFYQRIFFPNYFHREGI
ncbi:MAG: hypothetical protein Q8O72_01190 [Bacteroidales bacterium]|nr:hypothetical protein [Bacteroidales bacterium]